MVVLPFVLLADKDITLHLTQTCFYEARFISCQSSGNI